MASVARTIRAIKPHVPMIRFPLRNGVKEPTVLPGTSAQESSSQGSKVGSLTQILEFTDLPLKYQRKPISQEEMEYIERGGPL